MGLCHSPQTFIVTDRLCKIKIEINNTQLHKISLFEKKNEYKWICSICVPFYMGYSKSNEICLTKTFRTFDNQL